MGANIKIIISDLFELLTPLTYIFHKFEVGTTTIKTGNQASGLTEDS